MNAEDIKQQIREGKIFEGFTLAYGIPTPEQHRDKVIETQIERLSHDIELTMRNNKREIIQYDLEKEVVDYFTLLGYTIREQEIKEPTGDIICVTDYKYKYIITW